MSYPLNKIVTTQIHPTLTADDWQLYTSSMDCTEAVGTLNETLKFNVNTGADRRECIEDMHAAMRRLARFGADDSEPHAVLERILQDIYGRDA